MDNFSDEENMTQLQDQVQKEREEKYKKLDQMTEKQKSEYFTEQAHKINETAKAFGANITNLDEDKILDEIDRPMIALDTCVLHTLAAILIAQGDQSFNEFYTKGQNSYKKAKDFYDDIINKIQNFYASENRCFNENAKTDMQAFRNKFEYFISRKLQEKVFTKENDPNSKETLYKALTKLILQIENKFLLNRFWQEISNKPKGFEKQKRKELYDLIDEIFKKAGKTDKNDPFKYDLNNIIDYLKGNSKEAADYRKKIVVLLAESNGKTCNFDKVGELYPKSRITDSENILNKANEIFLDQRKFKIYGKKLDGEKLFLIEMLREREKGVLDICILGENLDELMNHLNSKGRIHVSEKGLQRLLSVCKLMNIKFDYDRDKLNNIYDHVDSLSKEYMTKPQGQAGSVMPDTLGALFRTSDPICMAESSIIGCLYVTVNVKDYIKGEKSKVDDIRQHVKRVNSKHPYATNIIPVSLSEFNDLINGNRNLINSIYGTKKNNQTKPQYESRDRLISIVKDEKGVYKIVGDPNVLPSSKDTLVFIQKEMFFKGDMPTDNEEENN